jgi:hypothetical protein
MKQKLLFIALLAVAAIGIVFFSGKKLATDYKRFNEEQAKKQRPVGIRDPLLMELKAKLFRAGYEARRGADVENKPSRETVLQMANQVV